MNKPLNDIGYKEFRRGILTSASDKSAWYFMQTQRAYYADYRPKYPDHTAADLLVCLDFGTKHGNLKIYGNLSALVPTIKPYSSIDELLTDLAAKRKAEIAEEHGGN